MHICSRQPVSIIDTQIHLPPVSTQSLYPPCEGDFERIPNWREGARLYLFPSKLGLDAKWPLHSDPEVWFLL